MKQERGGRQMRSIFSMPSDGLSSNGCEGALHYYARRKRIKERVQKR